MDETTAPPPTPTPPPPAPPTPTPSTTLPPEQPPQSPPPQPPPQQPQPQSQPPPTSSTPPPPPPPNPNPTTPQPPPQTLTPQPRPPFNRTWPQTPPPPYSHFPPSSPVPRPGGMAIGVPAQPSTPPTSFSSISPSYGQSFAGIGRGTGGLPDSATTTTTTTSPLVRQPVPGMQGVGMIGTLGSSPSMRPSSATAPLTQRPAQSSFRPQAGTNVQSPAAQNFQAHGALRGPSVGSPVSPSPNTLQSSHPHNQPWLSSGSQGKPPLPPPSYRPQINSPSMQQRPHIPPTQQHHTLTPAAPAAQQMTSTSQPQTSSVSHQPQEHYSLPPSRIPQSPNYQQQAARARSLVNPKPSTPANVQPSAVQPTSLNRITTISDSSESCNRILSKRSIHELITQIDPSERWDPEVEDILVDIAEEFVESVTSHGCLLAKHRKSNTLEAKDILLHLERNWNMSLPGFGGDEIKTFKKPTTIDIHKERLALIKKSESSKTSAGQASGSAKANPVKPPANMIGSPIPR